VQQRLFLKEGTYQYQKGGFADSIERGQERFSLAKYSICDTDIVSGVPKRIFSPLGNPP
jgi:hypothetical protein